MRWLPEGALEFLGRLDGQVKIRGYRIEPAEVEVALAGHPAVREAAVVAREGPAGEKHLVAYVVPGKKRRRGAPPAGELRRFLQGRLPGYMVPAAFVVLGALPLTANGKVDRAALPTLAAGGGTGLEPDAAFVAPRSSAEMLLATIWAEVLGVSRVGVHDYFFALGDTRSWPRRSSPGYAMNSLPTCRFASSSKRRRCPALPGSSKAWSARHRPPHHGRDVVAPASLERVLDQVLTDLPGRRHSVQPLPDPLIRDMAGAPVAAEQHDGVPVEADPGDDGCGLPPAYRARQLVLEPGAPRVGSRQVDRASRRSGGHRRVHGRPSTARTCL